MHCAGKQILYAAEGASFINYDGVWFWRKVKKFSALRADQFFRFASVELLPRPRWRGGQPARVSTPHRRLNFSFFEISQGNEEGRTSALERWQSNKDTSTAITTTASTPSNPPISTTTDRDNDTQDEEVDATPFNQRGRL